MTELDVWLLAGETIRPDAARLFRSRPPGYRNPLAESDGCPGVAFRWLEVEGPLYDEWPTAGHRLLFDDLPLKQADRAGAGVKVVANDSRQDAERLLRNFVRHAYRRPVAPGEEVRFLPVIEGALKSGSTFTDAMIAGYTAVLCSPGVRLPGGRARAAHRSRAGGTAGAVPLELRPRRGAAYTCRERSVAPE